MINMAVAHTAIQKGFKAGVWMGMGAALVELIQVFVALKFTSIFQEGGAFETVFQISATIIFFVAAIYFFFFAKTATVEAAKEKLEKKRNAFFKGMFISSFNLMVIPYWIFYGTLLTTNGLLEKENKHIIVFSLGAMLGAFLLLTVYAYLGDKVLRKSEKTTKWVNKFIGLILFGFGLYQLLFGLNGS